MDLMRGFATVGATSVWRSRGSREDAYSSFDGLTLSSIGLGTYHGDATEEVDTLYELAIDEAIRCGINVLDTANVYRGRRSERVIGQALRKAVERGASRNEFFVSTKGGYIPHQPTSEAHGKWIEWMEEQYVRPGIATWADIAPNGHCLRPNFIDREFERSRETLGIETIDLYYIHNPEEQLESVTRQNALVRYEEAFRVLEQRCDAGQLRFYGVATWDGLRVPPTSKYRHLSLEELLSAAARAAGGAQHHLRCVQLPFNVRMPQAILKSTQHVEGKLLPAIEAARRLGIYVFVSRSINQGILDFDFMDNFYERTQNLVTDQQRLLQIVRSTPGVGTALVGSTRRSRVREAALVMGVPKLTAEELAIFFGPRSLS